MDDESGNEMDWQLTDWKTRGKKVDKRKRDLDQQTVDKLSEQEIRNIIGIKEPTKKLKPNASKNLSENNLPEKHTQTNTSNKNSSVINYSPKMHSITKQQYKTLYYITTSTDMTRTDLADIWSNHTQNNNDVILKTKKGILLKSNTKKSTIQGTLSGMQKINIIKTFEETHANDREKTDTFTATFACVIASVETEIDEKHISEHLNNINIIHRYCKRIKSRATQNWTTLIRVITGDINSFEKLLNEGVFYKFRHYPVFPSKAPEPVPIPCSRCSLFTHTTENCKTPVTCRKCQGKHHTANCDSPLPPKCAACNSTDHQAWSMKCPKRPTSPIEGIPNTQVKSINKKSADMDPNKTLNSKIHKPITYHDHIIETYITELNNPSNTDRQELLLKLKKRFVSLHNIDTTAVFCGNRLYILMFDLSDPENQDSNTEPIEGARIHQEPSQNVS